MYISSTFPFLSLSLSLSLFLPLSLSLPSSLSPSLLSLPPKHNKTDDHKFVKLQRVLLISHYPVTRPQLAGTYIHTYVRTIIYQSVSTYVNCMNTCTHTHTHTHTHSGGDKRMYVHHVFTCTATEFEDVMIT